MTSLSQPSCAVVRSREMLEGKQEVSYFTGVSSTSVGASGICMHLLTIPPGQQGRAHLHEHHETAIYVLSGHARMWYGAGLQQVVDVQAGDFLYIPANTPHLPRNLSRTEPARAVVARTDPNEQESVVLLPELEPAVPARDGDR